jgi:hypothetical protein
VQVEGELEREARIRPEAIITEVLGTGFKDEDFPKTDILKLLKEPLKMEDGAVFLFERIQQIARLSLDDHTWDNRLLRLGVEVSPRATVTEILAAAQLRAGEPLEEASRYALYSGNKIAVPPWKSGSYALKPKVMVADSVAANFQGSSMTVGVPLFHPDQWQRIAYEAIPDAPIVCTQTVPREFTAYYQDDIRSWRAYFEANGMGEEHEIRAVPHWDNQILIVQ